jgi:hypothetical protein
MLTWLVMSLLWASGVVSSSADLWTPTTPSPFKVPEALEPALHDYRQEWTRLTDLQPSGLHWQQGIVIYSNRGGEIYRENHVRQQRDLEEGERDGQQNSQFDTYADGTVLLKENYFLAPGGHTKPASVTVMLKREKGYDPAMGDWQFVQFDASGQITLNGNSKDQQVQNACGFCHRGVAERDYVFSTIAPNPGDGS